MAVNTVPLMVDGGALHHAALMRSMAYMALREQAGVSGIGALRVEQTNPPSNEFRVSPGAVAIPVGPSSQPYQSYVALNQSETRRSVGSTGMSSGRSDMVIARVSDPKGEGAEVPGDPQDYEYFRIEVVSGVSPTAESVNDVPSLAGVSAVALARIDIPANTSQVIDDMVVDLRDVPQPRSRVETKAINMTTAGIQNAPGTKVTRNGTLQHIVVNSTPYSRAGYGAVSGGETWPAFTEDYGLDVMVPEWATKVEIFAMWSSVWMPGAGSAWGECWIQIGAAADPTHYATQNSRWDFDDSAAPNRTSFSVADTMTVKKEWRGREMRFYPRVNRRGGTNATTVGADWATNFWLFLNFQEAADPSGKINGKRVEPTMPG